MTVIPASRGRRQGDGKLKASRTLSQTAVTVFLMSVGREGVKEGFLKL